MAGGLDRVRDHEDGLSLLIDLAKEIEQRIGGAGIERSGRFVGEDELGRGNQRPRHGLSLIHISYFCQKFLGKASMPLKKKRRATR